jgi:hypothetical protein
VYDLLVDGRLAGQGSVTGGNTLTIDMATGPPISTGPVGTARSASPDLPDTSRRRDLAAAQRDHRTRRPAHRRPVAPANPGDRPVWLHHGSSISHGSDAASPTTTWPALAARSARGADQPGPRRQRPARPVHRPHPAGHPADLISVKIGINLVNTDLMRLRAFTPAVHGFLDTIRDGHPTTPLLVVSPIYCPIHEDTPGPGAFDLPRWRRKVRFRATGDPADVPPASSRCGSSATSWPAS